MAGAVKFTTRGLDEIRARIARTAALRVEVGVLGAAAQATEEDGATVGEIAHIHEYGAPSAGIPERSFLRRTMIDREADTAALLAKAAGAIVKGMDPTKALGLIGKQVEAWVKLTITSADLPPPLAEATIKAKKSSKPLVDHGQLIDAITYRVVAV